MSGGGGDASSLFSQHIAHVPLVQEQWDVWCAREQKDAALRAAVDPDEKYPWMSHCRPMLVDWMVQTCDDLNYPKSILYRAISLMDRAVGRPSNGEASLTSKNYQALGAAALYVVGLELDDHECLKHWVTNTGDIYTEEEIQKLSWWLLEQADWNITAPTSLEALDWILQYHVRYVLRSTTTSSSSTPSLEILKSPVTYAQIGYLLDACQHHPHLVRVSQRAIAVACFQAWSRKWNWEDCGMPPTALSKDLTSCVDLLYTALLVEHNPPTFGFVIKRENSHSHVDHFKRTLPLLQSCITSPCFQKRKRELSLETTSPRRQSIVIGEKL